MKHYLGDSVYAEFDEWNRLVLTTENGLPTDPSNIIVLEPEVLNALYLFCEKALTEQKKGEAK
jgi:hypothetical protein